jgi:ADP-glucose pyrophosphorylase
MQNSRMKKLHLMMKKIIPLMMNTKKMYGFRFDQETYTFNMNNLERFLYPLRLKGNAIRNSAIQA